MKSSLLVLGFGLIALVQTAAPRSAEPRMPFVDRGACPFEGCTYQDWIARMSVAALEHPAQTWELDTPASELKTLFTVKPGETVTAMTGIVVTTTPGHGRITKVRPHTSIDPLFPKAPAIPIDLAVGDVVSLLTYHGEGEFLGWAKSHFMPFSDQDDGKVVDMPKRVWWVQIRNSSGEIGWTTQVGEFDNTDAFGGPPEPTDLFVYELLPRTELKAGVHIDPLVGESGTFTLAEFDPGAQSFLHYHTQEQINLGLTGDIDISRAGHRTKLTPAVATLTPADVEHVVSNIGTTKATILEFQPVRRFDLLPPRPAANYAVGPVAVSLPESQLPTLDMASASWTEVTPGVRTVALAGARASVTMIGIVGFPNDTFTLQSQPATAEQFFYVYDESIWPIVSGKERYRIDPGHAFLLPRTATSLSVRLANRSVRLARFDIK